MIFGTVKQNGPKVETQEENPSPLPPCVIGKVLGHVLSDEEVLAPLKKDPAAGLYWSGYPANINRSEADFALACKLAFYSGRNLQQMERLFRQSALASRPKARTRRGDLDYIGYTLWRAWEKQVEVWKPKRRAKSPNPPGRPRCKVNPQEVIYLRSTGQIWRTVSRTLSIGTATAMRLCKGHPCIPKKPQDPEELQDEVASPTTCSDSTVNGQPGRITAAVTK
jgi:hypothetical protein